MNKVLLLFFLLFLGFSNLSQLKLDSLWNQWQNTSQVDTNRLNSLKTFIIEGYLYNDPDSSVYYSEIYYEYAKSKGLKKYISSALNIKGISFYFQGKYNKAITCYQQALKIQIDIKDHKSIAATLNNIGAVYYERGNYNLALENWTNSLVHEEKINNLSGIASTYSNIGVIYKELNEDSIAIDYYNKSLKIQKEINNKLGVSNCLNNIGVIYLTDSLYDDALEYFFQAIKIYEEIEAITELSTSLHNIGLIYSAKGEIDNALDYLNRSMDIQKRLKDQIGTSASLNAIAELFQKQSNYNKSILLGSQALEIAQEISAVNEIRNAARILSESYAEIGNNQKAYNMLLLYEEINHTITMEENDRKIFIELERNKHLNEKKVLAEQHRIEQDNKDEQHRIEQDYKDFQRSILFGVLGLTLLFTGFMYNRFRISNKHKKLIEKQKDQVDNAFDELELKNNEIMDSINYAKRIQSAILPPYRTIKEHLENSFIFYQPKDIVAGDFYWLEPTNSKTKDKEIIFAVADCTGHGVPGAMVSVVCNNGLNRSVREHGITDPGEILNKTLEIITEEFEKSEDDVKDGMDIALCKLVGDQLSYAGAHNPLWIIRHNSNEVEEISANKQSIGIYEHLQPFQTKTTTLMKGDTFYLFTDGYIDQFGGERGKKYKSKNLKSFLLSIQGKDMKEQQILLKNEIDAWTGSLEQIDDICVMGVRV